jgi:hypothetical protein
MSDVCKRLMLSLLRSRVIVFTLSFFFFFGQKRCFHPAKGMLLRCNRMENGGLSDASCRVKRMFIG